MRNNRDISGVQNENEFADYLNGRSFVTLNDNASRFVRQLYPLIEGNSIISAKKVGGKGLKPDVLVSVANEEFNISLKKGGGNSVHQEKTSLFLLYCKENLGMDDVVRDSFRAYLYGDGTLDGKGDVEDRVDGEELKLKYRDEIRIIQDFLIKNSRVLIERFLVYGRLGRELNIKADYLYHGFIDKGDWCPLDETVDFLVEKAKMSRESTSPSLGPLTLQTWNRNIKGNPETESRRQSIQIKWGGAIKEYINQINLLYLQKLSQNRNLNSIKIIGDNSHGFRNADDISRYLNGIRVRNLNKSLLGMINTIFKGVALTDIIECRRLKPSCKPDIQIKIGNTVKTVSIFVGSGNSVHQENFISFLNFCREKLQITKDEEDSIRWIFYGDYTYDGTGSIENRISNSRTILNEFPLQASIAQSFFDRNRRVIARRFLITGKDESGNSADYVFHGNIEDGICVSYEHILDYIESYNEKKAGLLSIGPLSFQMWNRNLSGVSKNEYKRNSLQIKWPSMDVCIKEAIEYARFSQEKLKISGINAEYELVYSLNRNRNLHYPLWQILNKNLNFDITRTYAVRVSKQVYSQFLGRTIYPKSDVYLCEINDTNVDLKNIGYAIDEDVLKEHGIAYSIIYGSGISCKMPTSKNYTYAKISSSNFVKIFNNAIIGAGASFFVNIDDLKLNKEILSGWGVNEKDFFNYIKENNLCNKDTIEDLSVNDCKIIKSYCIGEITYLLKTNKILARMIFMGEGLYEDPYNASFLFEQGVMKRSYIPNIFNVTTGSGRHKGIYTIIFKPSLGKVSKLNTSYEVAREEEYLQAAEARSKYGDDNIM